MLPPCPTFPLTTPHPPAKFTLRIPNQEEGERQELRLHPDHTPLDGFKDSSARDMGFRTCVCNCGFRGVFRFHGASRPFLITGQGGRMRVAVLIYLFPILAHGQVWTSCFPRASLSSSLRWGSETHLAQSKHSVNTLNNDHCCCDY